jgi:hypothetical protein
MQKWLFLLLVQFTTLSMVYAQQKAVPALKDGKYIEEYGELRGEPGYTWEGTYKNGRKEGIWVKTSTMGEILAEETFKNNVLDGLAKYYFPNGKLSAAGMFIATEIDGQRDTIRVIDPITGAETPTEIIRKGNSVKNGVWKMYDEETGKMFQQYFKRGEEVAPEELGETPVTAPVKPAGGQLQLPHEKSSGKKKNT